MTHSSPDGPPAISVEEKFCLSVVESFVASCGRILEFRRDDEEPDCAVIWLLIDHLLLTFQEPVYVTIGLVRDKTIIPVISNLSMEDRLYDGLRSLEDEFEKRDNDAVRIEVADVVASIRYLPREWEKDDRWEGERWPPTGIGDTYSNEAVHALLNLSIHKPYRLSDALRYASSARKMSYNPHFVGGQVVTDQEIDEWYIKPLQTRIGTTLDTFSRRLLTSSTINSALNLFLVAKQPATTQRHVSPQTVPSEYDLSRQAVTYQHSAALILATKEQREALRHDNREPDEAYYPLQQGERSISDTPLLMGNVDFGLPNETIGNGYSRSYRDETKVSPEIWNKMGLRRSHETQLFNLAFGGKAPDRFSIFYVPIHVHGRPWFAAFTMVAVADETQAEHRYARMMHCLHFYRDVVPEVAGSIARATLEAFGEQLGAAVARNLESDAPGLIDRVNREWGKIGTMYPYGIPSLCIDDDGADSYPVQIGDDRSNMYIRFSDQKAPLKKRELAAQTVVDLIGRRIEAAYHVRAQSRRSVSEVTAHEWVKGQSTAKELAAAMFTRIDKLNRLRQRGAEAIDPQLLPLSAILKSTLDTTFGLPFVLREVGLKRRSCGQYFSGNTPTREDLSFVDRLLECCGRSVLAEELVFRVPDHDWELISDASREISYSFSINGASGFCTHKKLIDAELDELLKLVRSLDNDTVEARWPAAEVVNKSRDAYRGVLGVLTLAPRELLRNAASHGDGGLIAFDVDVVPGSEKNPTTLKCTVSNRLKLGANPEVPRLDVLTKFDKIRRGLPFLSEPVIECAENKFLASVTISLGGEDA